MGGAVCDRCGRVEQVGRHLSGRPNLVIGGRDAGGVYGQAGGCRAIGVECEGTAERPILARGGLPQLDR